MSPVLTLGHAFEARRLHALDPDSARERPREDEDEEAEQKADTAVGEPLDHFGGGASWTWKVSSGSACP